MNLFQILVFDHKYTPTMDIRFNQSSKVCAYSSDDKELCTALTEESEIFVESEFTFLKVGCLMK